MNYTLLVLLLTNVNVVIAQKGETVSSVLIDFSKGHNSWGDPGIYATGEIFNISRVSDHQFRMTKYLRINYNAGKDGKTFKRDTLMLPPNGLRNRDISQYLMDSLISQLNTSEDNFNLNYIKPKLNAPTRNAILGIAKRLDEEYKLQGDDEKIDKTIISHIKNFDQLDRFITIHRPDKALTTVAIDAWDQCSIQIHYNSGDTTKYRGDFFQLLGQPFYRLNKKGIDRPCVNLLINTLISNFLPKTSLLRTEIEINNLTNQYIEWYIDKVL